MDAEMYALADKYEMSGLKTAAQNKFGNNMDLWLSWTASRSVGSFPSLISLVYSSTPISDRLLRDRVVAYAQEAWKLIPREEVLKTMLAANLDFALDMVNSKPLVIEKQVYQEVCRTCRSTDQWKPITVVCSCGRWERL